MNGNPVNKENEDWFVHQVALGRLTVSSTEVVTNVSTGHNNWALGGGRYPKISLKDLEANKIRHVQVHRLVYRVLKGDIAEGNEIDHDDNNKKNNHPDNLIQLTHEANSRKAYDDGLVTGAFKTGNRMQAKRKYIGNGSGRTLAEGVK